MFGNRRFQLAYFTMTGRAGVGCARLFKRRVLGVGAGAVLLACAGAMAGAQETVIKAEVHLVNFTFSVRDADGKIAAGLTADDFEVFEDGVAQKVSFFAQADQLPLTIGLVVDVSNSQDKFLKQHNRDIQTFLEKIMRPEDQAFAICFGNRLRLVSDVTSSVPQVMDGLKRYDKGDREFAELAEEHTRESGTALYDAVFASATEKLAGAANRRRALILFTDGEENSSEHDLVDAISAAQDADTLVYAVRYTQMHKGRMSASNKQGMRALDHLTAQTGGTAYDALHTNLPEAFEQIGGELRSLYSLAYHATNKLRDGSFRKVVLVPKRAGLTVRTKAGYYAR